MGRHYGVPTNDFSDVGSKIARVASMPFKALWWLTKMTLYAVVGLSAASTVTAGAALTLALGTVVRAAYIAVLVWAGWNNGLTHITAVNQIDFMTALWCSLPLTLFVGGSSKSSS